MYLQSFKPKNQIIHSEYKSLKYEGYARLIVTVLTTTATKLSFNYVIIATNNTINILTYSLS